MKKRCENGFVSQIYPTVVYKNEKKIKLFQSKYLTIGLLINQPKTIFFNLIEFCIIFLHKNGQKT